MVLALTEMPAGSVRLYVNIGDGEALNFANSLTDPLTQSRWKTDFAGSTPYPMPGLWILVQNASGPLPKDAENLGRALQKCGIPFTERAEPDLIRTPGEWALVAGAKPD